MKPAWEKKQTEIVSGMSGRETPGSGNKWFAPADGNNRFFSMEVKTTLKGSFSLKKETLDKIRKEALFHHKFPAIIIDIQGTRWAAVPFDLFQAMAKVWADNQDKPPP